MQKAFIRAGLLDTLQTVPDAETAVSYLSGDRTFSDRRKYPVPAVVLLDLKLPGMSGIKFLEWLRSQGDCRDLPVVVFSATEQEGQKAKCKALQVEDYWIKPVSPQEFLLCADELRERWLGEE